MNLYAGIPSWKVQAAVQAAPPAPPNRTGTWVGMGRLHWYAKLTPRPVAQKLTAGG